MKNKTSNTYPTTSEKLGRVLAEKKTSMAEVSREMGYDSGCISNQISACKGVRKNVANWLKLKYGLNPEDYAPDKPQKAETPAQEQAGEQQNTVHAIPAEVQKELHDLIYAAVLAGTVTALRLTGDEAEQITNIWRKNNA